MGRLIGVAAWLALALAACKAATNEGSSAATGGAGGGTGVTSARERKRDAGTRMSTETPVVDAGVPEKSPETKPTDASMPPAAAPAMDAAAMMTGGAGGADASMGAMVDAAPGPDARIAPSDLGSCCAAHDNAGCSNADLQVCVCEKLPSCCTDVWDATCVLIVKQKYCQAGVRDCVCGDGPMQWGQHACCDSSWSDTFCNQVAEQKCGATPGCL